MLKWLSLVDFLLRVNMVNQFVIIKKGKFVEFILVGCSVLMITNLIEQLYTWAWWPIRFCKQACECLCWLIVIKNKWRNQIETLIAEDIYWRSRSTAHLRHLMIDLQEQSSRLKSKEPRWSEELPKLGCWSTCDWFQDCLEGLQESLYLLCLSF